MKNIPNLITSIRLIAALAVICSCFMLPGRGTTCFLTLFVVAGISDMLDGYIARRFDWCTEFGAKLDSISDLALYAAVAIFLWLNAHPELNGIKLFLLLGAGTQMFHLVLAVRKHHQFPAYHTTFSRVCAYLLFFGINGFWLTKSAGILPLLALAWTACSIEGIVITMVLRRPLTNVNGIRTAIVANRTL